MKPPSPFDAFAAQLGARWITGSGLARYGEGEGPHRGRLPEVVAQPRTVEEVQRLAALAHAHRTPITPFGAGTSLEGAAMADLGGVCVDFSLMDAIREVAAEDLLCVVEPGVTRERLNLELRDTGLLFPVDPGADATLGGMISTRASGTTTVRYGAMRENTLALKVVLPDGRLLKTGTRARKSAAGYDLTHLFVGSEGTLGLIVEATLRLHGAPEGVLAGVWPFPSLDAAVATVIAAIQTGVPVARIELLDPAAIRACNAYSDLGLAGSPRCSSSFTARPARSPSSRSCWRRWASKTAPTRWSSPTIPPRSVACGRPATRPCRRRGLCDRAP